MKTVQTVIIGGGHAGVNLALWLQRTHRLSDYIILEQAGSLLDSWRTKRWDSFQLNTPHRLNLLHGQVPFLDCENVSGQDFDRQLQGWMSHIEKNKLKYRTNSRVQQVVRKTDDDKARFVVHTRTGDEFGCHNVVCCSGENAIPKLPKVAGKVPGSIKSIHSGEFNGPQQFPGDRAILVVGSGQSGMQIADLLATSGKDVWLCSSLTPGVMRSYRGEDLFVWLHDRMKHTKITNEIRQSLPNGNQMRYSKKPFTGTSKAISYFSIARKGVKVLGSLEDITEQTVLIRKNRSQNVKASVAGYEKFLGMLRDFVSKQPKEVQASYAPEENELEWGPVDELLKDNGPREVSGDLFQGIIWCTGFHSAVQSYLNIPEAQDDFNSRTGSPDYIASPSVPGLYYAGFPWVRISGSDMLLGFEEDDRFLSAMIANDE